MGNHPHIYFSHGKFGVVDGHDYPFSCLDHLLMLVSAFAGTDRVLQAYRER
jgi:S-adenosylmethionine:tRNA-ribosyltransferase-isomerase (queuine synthetase)